MTEREQEPSEADRPRSRSRTRSSSAPSSPSPSTTSPAGGGPTTRVEADPADRAEQGRVVDPGDDDTADRTRHDDRASTPRKEHARARRRGRPDPQRAAARARRGASSCSARRRRSSSRRATTRRRWTTSPTAAGVSKPVLYQHFPGKLELYLALLDQHADAMVAAVREALASTTDNKQRVAATIEAYFRFVDEDGGAFRLVFESDLTNQPAVRERVDGATLACAELISEVIRDDAGLPERAGAAARRRPGRAWPRWRRATGSPTTARSRATRRRGCSPACPGAASAASPAAGEQYASAHERAGAGDHGRVAATPRRQQQSTRRSPWRSGSVSSTRPASW